MKLSEILDTFESLDRAYDTVEEEVLAAGNGLFVPTWESIVRERPRREPGAAAGELRCASHGGAPHGLPFDALSDHLVTEFAVWTRLAEHSDTVRAALGIERIAPTSSGRIGAMLYVDGDLELRAKLSASGASVTATEAGRWLWVREAPEKIDFRPRQAIGESYLLFSNDGKGRRWSFSDLKKGYEDYLLAMGHRPDPGETEALWSAPIPRLLGAVSGYNSRNRAERAPIVLSEAWIWDAASGERAGELAKPCDACRFGLSVWMCGHAEMLLRGASANFDYAKRSRQWVERLRDRAPPRRSRTGIESDVPPHGSVIPKGAKATDTLVSGEPGADIVAAALKETGTVLPTTTRVSKEARAAVARLTAPRVRERVRIRLESEAMSSQNVEIREIFGRETLSRLFSFQVDVVCFDEDGLDVERMVGATASLVFERGPLTTRRIHGMITEVLDRLETEGGFHSYRLWIAPRAWRATLVEASEVHRDIGVPALVVQKLGRAGLSRGDVETRLLGSYPVRERIEQSRETDLAFVSRLAEEIGVCFFFEHDSGVDRMILSDESAGFRPLLGAESLPFRPRGEKVDVFEIQRRLKAFPAFAMLDNEALREGSARIRGEARTVENRTFEGKSDRCELLAGGTFELLGHPRLPGLSLLVVEVEHHARQAVRTADAASDEEPYRNTFRAVDARLPYRPPRPR